MTTSISDLHLKLRSGDISLPEPKVEGYKIPYKTVEIEKPKPKVTLERKLGISFRVDANYDLYEALKEWQELLFTDDGGYSPLKAGSYGKIVVSTYNSSGEVDSVTNRARKWTFDNVWFSGFEKGIDLKREGADPVKVTGDFKFIQMSTT